MYKVTVNGKLFFAEENQLLMDFFIKNNIKKEHPCGGKGVCKNCLVMVNGKEELSCKYKVNSDITVNFNDDILPFFQNDSTPINNHPKNYCFCLDLGTTTLVLALTDLDSQKIIAVKSVKNPQSIYGADVISRISYCTEHGVKKLQEAVITEINTLIDFFNLPEKVKLFVSANTTMLHIFSGINPESLGKAPYTPVFSDFKYLKGSDLNLKNIDEVIILPSFAAFAGADLVAGLNFIDSPNDKKFNLLVDLGTNAEIIVFSKEKIYCTSAAAGPCFEGANISQGMTSSNGAIYKYELSGSIKTINDSKPIGICATGLIDIISVLLKKGIIDETGYMKYEKFEIAPGIFLTDGDVRQVQLAKSAVYSGILTLLKLKNISYEDIDTLYISGGFSDKINIKNAVDIGLIPKELQSKAKSIGNSSLFGTAKYAAQKNDLTIFIEKAQYIDLAKESIFSDLFIENMKFDL